MPRRRVSHAISLLPRLTLAGMLLFGRSRRRRPGRDGVPPQRPPSPPPIRLRLGTLPLVLCLGVAVASVAWFLSA